MVTREELIELLREGLSHLYDAEHLRQSPLVTLFGVGHWSDSASVLRNILVESVQSLKPEDGAPCQSRDWRLYEALFYGYVQQLDQRIVADQLALSVRHLRREQRAALELLADRLWAHIESAAESPRDIVARVSPVQTPLAGPDVGEELAWLKDLPSEKPTDLEEALSEVLNLIQPLAAQHGVHLEVRICSALPNLAMHPVALNQILLSLLSVAILQAEKSEVRISARPLRWQVQVQIQPMCSLAAPRSISEDDRAGLRMAHQLATLCGGTLTLQAEDGAVLDTVLTLPALNQLVVLVIDDNADTLQLLQRYTAGTRYRLVGTQDPGQALVLAEKYSPQVIVLDVMMPQVDGWKLMGLLRQHPLTSHVPIVVCTILAQEKLALSLGASGFIRKPVTRQALLDTLNCQIEPETPLVISPERGSH